MTAAKSEHRVLPDVFRELVEDEGTKQFLFRVESDVNWRVDLAGARLRTEPGEAPEVIQIDKDQKPPVVKHRFLTTEIQDPWQQYLPLRLAPEPAPTEEAKKPRPMLQVNRAFGHVFHLERETPELKRIEEELKQKRAALAKGEKRKRNAVIHERAAAEEQKLAAQKRFKLTSTLQALQAVGFSIDEAEPPAEAGSARDDDEAVLRLMPLPEEKGGACCVVPVGFWTPGPLQKEMREQVEIKWSAKAGRESFPVKLRCSPEAAFVARQVKQKTSQYRYLLGLKKAGSKKVILEEATILRIVPEKKVSKEEGEEAAKKGYGELKGAAVDELGTSARKRQSNLVAARKARNFAIEEFGEYRAELKERAEQLASRMVSDADRDADLKAKLLPPFDLEATGPEEVYAKSLGRIAPLDLILQEKNLVSQEMRELLLLSPEQQTQAVCDREQASEIKLSKKDQQQFADRFALRSRLAACVLKQRVQAGLDSSTDEIAARFGVLEKLVMMVSRGLMFKGGKVRVEAIAELLEMPSSSRLCWAWHKEYYDELQDKIKVRTFNTRRTLCYLMIWALHLVPNFELVVPNAAERELGLGQGKIKQALTYVGCTVTEQTAGSGAPGSAANKLLVAKLKGPPQPNEKFYNMAERMAAKKSKKAGGRGD